MTGSGLWAAFGFVRTCTIGVCAVVLADGHPVLIGLAVLAVVALACIHVSRHRRIRPEDSGARPPTTGAWWLGIAIPFGLGVWASFLYVGVRTRRREWLAWSLAYASVIVVGCVLNTLGNDGTDPTLGLIAVILWTVMWAAGALHGYRVQGQVRAQLLLARRGRESVATTSAAG